MKWKKYASRFHPPLSAKLLQLAQAPEHFKRLLNVDFGIPRFIMVERQFYIDESTFEDMRDYLSNQIRIDDVRFLLNFRNECQKNLTELTTTAERIYNEPKGDLAVGDIIENFSSFNERYQNVCTFLPIFRAIGSRIEQILMTVLEESGFGGANAKEKMYLLTQPTKETETTREHVELLKIAEHIKKAKVAGFRSDEVVQDMVARHVERFFWVGLQWYTGAPVTEQEINDRLNNLLLGDPKQELDSIRVNQEKAEQQFLELLSTWGIDEGARSFIELSKDYTFLRTHRSDVANRAIGLIYDLLVRVSNVFGVSYDELIYLTPDEVIEHLQGIPVDKNRVDSRREGFASLFIDGQYSIVSGVELAAFKSKARLNEDSTTNLQVRGIVACQGKAQGKVKVVRSIDDLPKVERGDVLVAVMTFPAYIPALEKAAAFVTDDGGILCHAALIAREMHKPCVIGTSIATQTFRDGDEVEVNAEGEDGVVSRLVK